MIEFRFGPDDGKVMKSHFLRYGDTLITAHGDRLAVYKKTDRVTRDGNIIFQFVEYSEVQAVC